MSQALIIHLCVFSKPVRLTAVETFLWKKLCCLCSFSTRNYIDGPCSFSAILPFWVLFLVLVSFFLLKCCLATEGLPWARRLDPTALRGVLGWAVTLSPGPSRCPVLAPASPGCGGSDEARRHHTNMWSLSCAHPATCWGPPWPEWCPCSTEPGVYGALRERSAWHKKAASLYDRLEETQYSSDA